MAEGDARLTRTEYAWFKHPANFSPAMACPHNLWARGPARSGRRSSCLAGVVAGGDSRYVARRHDAEYVGFMMPSRPFARMRAACRFACLLPVAWLVALLVACRSNPFDATQTPRVTVTPVSATSRVVIGWQPAGAQLVRVYTGTTAGDGYSDALVWSIAATSRNSLIASVEYGQPAPVGGTTDVAAKALVAGQSYTVQVTRQDPNGTGDGFTNTSHRYIGVQTFTIAATSKSDARPQ